MEVAVKTITPSALTGALAAAADLRHEAAILARVSPVGGRSRGVGVVGNGSAGKTRKEDRTSYPLDIFMSNRPKFPHAHLAPSSFLCCMLVLRDHLSIVEFVGI
jgi:hypothetical protein